ncbi:hypothetical protein KIL84_005083 [Mauremys mutica]|uniref:Uncharacterized protein n=1 Tax=Mauremys mutica TaxID=74926 RepID=A0A9D3XJZ6_9SAUR|nr:hypothetical protein KIL84_005083 [Mauremys mutica]
MGCSKIIFTGNNRWDLNTGRRVTNTWLQQASLLHGTTLSQSQFAWMVNVMSAKCLEEAFSKYLMDQQDCVVSLAVNSLTPVFYFIIVSMVGPGSQHPRN